MDFANKGERPAPQQPTPQPHKETMKREMPQMKHTNNKGGFNLHKASSIFIVLGVAILAAALVAALVFGGEKKDDNLESSLIKTDLYQAVFLDSQDGQVYFGKLAIYNDETYILSDIYYVRVENPIQPQAEGAQPNISLAKLGNELHGPEDTMFISRDKVLYWENLKNDGQVVTAITDFKANGEQAPTTQQTQQTTQQQTNTNTTNTQQETTTTPTTTP